jgi:hypothetical protein
MLLIFNSIEVFLNQKGYSRNHTCLSLGRVVGYLLLKGSDHLAATTTTTHVSIIVVRHVTNWIKKIF